MQSGLEKIVEAPTIEVTVESISGSDLYYEVSAIARPPIHEDLLLAFVCLSLYHFNYFNIFIYLFVVFFILLYFYFIFLYRIKQTRCW